MGKYSTMNPIPEVLFESSREAVLAKFFQLWDYYTDRATLQIMRARVWPTAGSLAPNAPSQEGLRNLPPNFWGPTHKGPDETRMAIFEKTLKKLGF